MLTPPVPESDHVLRYVKKKDLRRDENDHVIGTLPDAFRHREDEAYLSATWLEHFSSVYEDGFRAAANAVRSQLTVKPRDGFTVGKVEDVRSVASRFDAKVRVLHEPEPPNNIGHCAIRGLTRSELDVLDALAAEAFTDTR